jgi:hypothetical protein
MTRRILSLTIISALAALVVAGAALAQRPSYEGSPLGAVTGSPNDQAGMIGVGAVAASAQAPDAFERAVIRANRADAPDVIERAAIRATADTLVRPDDRAGMRGPGLVATADTLVRPDDRNGVRGPGSVPTGSVVAASSSDKGFEWGDASLGAGLMLALVLAVGLVGLTIRHRGGPVSA